MNESLRLALTDTFLFYVKAQIYHWNVRGPTFPSLHSLFGDIYKDAWAAVDDLAERMRTLDILAPRTIQELTKGTKINFIASEIAASRMVSDLRESNEVVITALTEAFTAANASNPGLSDFLQARLDTHAKWAWMLKATEGNT